MEYIKLSVLDFDGTLVNTPLPTEENKKKWADYHEKEEWPYLGWWGRMESLDMDVWDMELIPDTIKDYKKEKSNPTTLVVMLTGRHFKLKNNVISILERYGLKFDRYLFNNGGETSQDKIKQLNQLLFEYPSIKEVELWDDRDSHIDIFNKWGDTLESINFKINHVPSFNHK